MTGYADQLPAVLREDPALVDIVGVFEAILSGAGPPMPGAPVGIEAALTRVHRHFQPGPGAPDHDRAPPEFLPWLARWVGVVLRDDWDTATRRRFLANAIPLYRLRGTRAGLLALLELFLDGRGNPVVHEFEDPPHFFQVEVTQDDHDPLRLAHTDRCLRAIIDGEKPAHAVYGLRILFATMRLVDAPASPDEGIYVGINTTLGQETYRR